MDWLEDRSLAGALVSADDRAAWWRWVKRRKKKLPKTSSSRSFSFKVHAEVDVGAGDQGIMFRYGTWFEDICGNHPQEQTAGFELVR